MNPEGWVVRFEVGRTSPSGDQLTYVVEAKIADLGLAQRSIAGTWKNNEESGTFKIRRQ